MEILVTALVFGAAMGAMSIGLIFNGRSLQGSCGAASEGPMADDASCGACSRKEAEVCPSDDPLVRIAQIGHPDPLHHR